MPYLAKPNILEVLKKIYPDYSIDLRRVEYNGIISVFFVTVSSSFQLLNGWDKISSSIASYYQPYLESDFERWNVYVIYMSEASIDISLKYKIENDRFSSRKIVQDQVNTSINTVLIEKIISENITNSDISMSNHNDVDRKKKYESDTVTWEIIKEALIRKGKGSSIEVNTILEQLISKLQNENKES